MKRVFKVFSMALCLCLSVAVLTGCGSSVKKTSDNSKDEKVEEKKSKGNCTVFECIDKLDAKKSLEEVNSIIGFEGTLKSETESYKVYNWDLTEDTSITVQFMTKYGTSIISTNFPNSMVDNKADFSKWDEIQTKIKSSTGIKYDEFVELVGGVKGVMTKKTDTEITYKWINAKGGFLSAYFKIETGKCSSASGRF